ncbi:MAG TPA: Vms1/Ankzf1 family peptidyl-tRNA hydrolase [Dehalococcoidia bacterium]
MIERLHVSHRELLSKLPEDGTPGTTQYRLPGDVPAADEALLGDDARRIIEVAATSETGSVLCTHAGGATLVVPAFAIETRDDYSEVYAGPLRAVLDRERVYAVLLLRLGGFSVGFFRGAALVDSKTDQRFVKNRHRKGGQSQRRFDRIREKQVDELFGKACETARETLTPYEAEIEHVFFGGDRHTLQAFHKECSYFQRFGARVMQRVLPVPGDPRRASLDAIPREVWSSELYVTHADATGS